MKTLILSLFLAMSLLAVAQKQQSSISFGPSLGIPPSFHGTWGSGASLRGYIGASRKGAVLINSSLLFYPSYYEDRTVSMLKVGYATQVLRSRLFFYGDAGVAINYGGSTRRDPVAGIGLGYSLPIGERKYVDFAPSWNFRLGQFPGPWISYSSNLELHFAYRFAFK